MLFHQTCTVCHGFFAESAGVVPDLRLSTPDVFSQYKDIVLDGALAANGMASFADNLKESDVEAIRQYVLGEANKVWTATHPAAPATPGVP